MGKIGASREKFLFPRFLRDKAHLLGDFEGDLINGGVNFRRCGASLQGDVPRAVRII